MQALARAGYHLFLAKKGSWKRISRSLSACE